MVSSLFLLVTPLLLASSVSAAPKQLVQLGPADSAEIRCNAQAPVATTVTTTVYIQGPAPTPAQGSTGSGSSGTQQGGSPVKPPSSGTQQGNDQIMPPPKPQTSAGSSPGSGYVPVPNTSPSSNNQPPNTADTSGNSTSQTSGYRNVLYFTNWGIYGADYQPQKLPVDKITHVLYAFADIAPDGEVKSSDSYADLDKHYPEDSWNDSGTNAYGIVKQLGLLKKKNRQMKVLLSIGGWTYSPKFPPVAATEAGRTRFCTSAVTLVKDWGLDGLDIDWEYPANAVEAQNFVLLLKKCRETLDDHAAQYAPGYHFIQTVAAPAGPQHYNIMNLPAMDRYLDFWNLMAYDYAGSWDSTSGHQSNLFTNTVNPQSTKFNTEQAVRDFIAKGIPSNKIILGLPLYGRAFEATTGPGQPYNGIGPGSTQAGVWLYKDLPRPGAQELYDDVAMASYSFDRASGELISYDTVQSAIAKVKYLVKKGLGGTVFWEAAGDRSDEGSLVKTVAGQMGRLEGQKNLLKYPASKYDNIRAGL
ncbi:endochitinase 1 [Podospora australis]|uniref:chitinase n=1 Tax=Podospora australis TaxID=1536484 RepID=A0AAN6X4N4_9PEZI|nr:endochitinase 1 [Podospora australis]